MLGKISAFQNLVKKSLKKIFFSRRNAKNLKKKFFFLNLQIWHNTHFLKIYQFFLSFLEDSARMEMDDSCDRLVLLNQKINEQARRICERSAEDRR